MAPEITTSYAIDSSTVAIHWDPLPEEDRNGVIREYEVFIYNVNTGKNQTVVFTTTTAIIGSLTPSFSYNFFVSAVTVAKGPYSTIINITMPEDGNNINEYIESHTLQIIANSEFLCIS